MSKNYEVKLNSFQVAALAKAFNKDTITIKRWAKANSSLLSIPQAIEIIKRFEKEPIIQKIII